MADESDGDRKDIDEILAAMRLADDVLHMACMQVTLLEKQQEFSVAFGLLGLEMALFRHAARIRSIAVDLCGAVGTKDSFLKIAEEMFDDVAEISAARTKIKKDEEAKKEAKKANLTVVK